MDTTAPAGNLPAAPDDPAGREASAFRDGFRAGFQAGESIGYGRANLEIAEAWHAVYEAVQRHARMRTHAELQALRYPNHSEGTTNHAA